MLHWARGMGLGRLWRSGMGLGNCIFVWVVDFVLRTFCGDAVFGFLFWSKNVLPAPSENTITCILSMYHVLVGVLRTFCRGGKKAKSASVVLDNWHSATVHLSCLRLPRSCVQLPFSGPVLRSRAQPHVLSTRAQLSSSVPV